MLKHGLLKKQGKSGAYFERYAVRTSDICACGACWHQLQGVRPFACPEGMCMQCLPAAAMHSGPYSETPSNQKSQCPGVVMVHSRIWSML